MSTQSSSRIGSIQPARQRWRVVVSAGRHPDGRRRQVVRTADTEQDALALLDTMVAEFGLEPRQHRPKERDRGDRTFAVALLMAGGQLGLLPRRSLRSIAVAVGISMDAAHSAYHSGLTAFEADRWAIACRVHPFEIWGWVWIDTALDVGCGAGRDTGMASTTLPA
jgi:hypothetical protein